MIWACPLCQEPLSRNASGVSCEANHRFDRAKQGYLHLLPAHHKRTNAPGDDRQMLQQRREFLQAGFYEPLALLLQEQWQQRLESQQSDDLAFQTLLDSGCGEGYYLEKLQQVSEHYSARVALYGIDISKEAAKLAGRSLSSGQAVTQVDIAVASGFQLPVQSNSVDVVLRIFAPGDSAEVARVLKSRGQFPQGQRSQDQRSDGEFWRVVPGAKHLLELKQKLYREVKHHDLPEAPEGFELIEQKSLAFTMSLDTNEAVRQLLEMTPFVWRGSREGKEALQASDSLKVTAEFVLQKYRVLVADCL